MSEEVLRQRLTYAAASMDAIAPLLSAGSGKLYGSSESVLRRVGESGPELRHAIGLLDHRAVCWNALVHVRDNVDLESNSCSLAGSHIPFEQARYLTTQAYLAATWAAADVVTQAAGRVLCTADAAKNESRTTNIWQHFMKKQAVGAPWLVSTSMRECFGWPVAMSYIVRNHFTHEGGIAGATPFFESGLGSDGFQVSERGWRYLLEQAGPKNYKVDQGKMRVPSIDPMGGRKLDVVLWHCHVELDDALGILAKTAAGMANMYATLLTE